MRAAPVPLAIGARPVGRFGAGAAVAAGLAFAAALGGCTPAVCGTAEYVLVYPGGDAEMFDTDGDADADLVEQCGDELGSFGYRRDDFGITEISLSPSTPEDTIESHSDMTLYLLGAGTLVFLSSHLEPGTTLGIEALAGTGLHKLGGTAGETYANYPLLDGSLEVLDGPRPNPDPVYEGYESWELRWTLTFGDPANGMELQRWDAEDWVQIGPSSSVGDPVDLPPDWTAPA